MQFQLWGFHSLHTKVKMCDNLFAVDSGVVVIYIDIDIFILFGGVVANI